MGDTMASLLNYSSPNHFNFRPLFTSKMSKFDLLRLVTIIYWFESKVLDVGDDLRKLLSWVSLRANPALRLLWHILHLAISVWFFLLSVLQSIESFLIASDLLKRYGALDISKVRYLAIVIDSEEARQTSKVLQLLLWLVDIGVKKVCLYDPEGVLIKYKEAITERFSPAKLAEEAATKSSLLTSKQIDFEFLSFSDNKEAAAKAANFLFVKHYASLGKEKQDFTEPLFAEALAAIGSGGPEPDLLLIYGPTRCHLGFPAWRLRYTEIVHMGPLKTMKFGSLVKAIYRYTMVHQNYGS